VEVGRNKAAEGCRGAKSTKASLENLLVGVDVCWRQMLRQIGLDGIKQEHSGAQQRELV
jgi:hypothetical protein